MTDVPATKLAILAISKPIANVIKERATKSHFFRQYVAMPPAQFYNWLNVRIRMWSLNLGKPVNIPQLNETMAIELGSNLLGELTIFSIAAVLLTFEYIRQATKESKKQAVLLIEKKELINHINDLVLQVERQDVQIRKTRKVIADMESRCWLRKLLLCQNDYRSKKPLKLNQLRLP